MSTANSRANDSHLRDPADTTHGYRRDATIHSLFESQVDRSPDDVAIVFEGDSLTYRELECRANQLGRRLLKMGVGPNVLVALCVERSLEMVVGLLGILKAGGSYVPLDPAYPADRIEFMLRDSHSAILLTQADLVATLPANEATMLCLDSEWRDIAGESDERIMGAASASDLAYVIYTSGSTGRPKGVEIPHRAVVNFLCSFRDEPGLSEKDILVAVTTLSFDIAGLELYLPLTVGARIILASRTVASDGTELSRLLAASGATVMQATPATWRLLLEADWQGDPEFRILCGGETLPRDLAERLLPLCGKLWNLYGPTEATIWSTIHRVESGAGLVPIGHPIANTEIQILDEKNKPVPVNSAGELYIGGDGLARGYLKRPELTAERFVAHPFDDTPGARLYRTGDLAKFRDDGTIEHMGRVDFQVKVRGFRIELGEIENALEQQHSVRQAVVLAREDVPGEKRLVAYVVSARDQAPKGRELRECISATLPDYMVPGLFVFLDSLPLTPNGKVDRKALPAPDNQRQGVTEDYVAPRTPNEELLANIWAEVLRIDRVGVEDNYFDLGGDSLKIAQIATRVRETLQVNVPIRAIFEQPTVAGLTAVIERLQRDDDGPKEVPIRRVPRDGHLPLSFAQERVWFIHQLNPQNLAYNFQSTLRFTGKLDREALERALSEIVRRHEAYRTTFPTVDGRPVQKIHRHEPLQLPVVDLSDLAPDDQDVELKKWCDVEFQRRFDLAKLPLVRWTLIRYSDTDNVLVHMEHHTVHDGWSFNLFLNELVELYSAFASGKPSRLPELDLQFADLAAWQHEWMQGEVSDHQLEYWKKELGSNPPVLELPSKGPRPKTQSFKGAAPRAEIPVALCNELRVLSRTEGTTLFMTMLAAFVALLHRYTGESDVAVGTFFANRRSRESESLIGMILNNVVIRASLEKDPTVRELMAQVRDVLLESANYQDVPFDRVVDAVQPKRDLSRNPLFQVIFSFHDEPMPERGLPGLDVKLTPVISNGSAKFDLGVIGIPHSAQVLGLRPGSESDGLTMIWEHSSDLFELSTIERMIAHYQGLLESMVASPDKRISELPMGTDEERHEQLVKWNATEADYPREKCVHHLIRAQAEKTPDAIAAVFKDEQLTYGELERRSNQLARYLRARNVGPGVLVGIHLERSLDMLVGLLGIWKAGGAYVPVDPAFPNDRQAFMVEDAALSILVTQAKLRDTLPVEDITQVCLDADRSAISGESADRLDDEAVTPESLAYVIYTSGSTGKPKGVQLPHRAVVNFLSTMATEPGLTAEDRLLAVTTLSFDIAGLELYLPLTVGARVVIADRDVAANGEELAKLIGESEATVMQATPTTWRMLIDSGWAGDPDITVLCGGEALPRALAEELLTRVKTVWNMYGPTETTIWSTIHPVQSGAGPVSIGRPIANTHIYLLDSHDQPVPLGVVGELCIGGDGVALGYLGRPQLTAEKFVDHPFVDSPGAKIYRTGDLARYRPDRRLECLGRTDHQVKVRGFRIELGEIETAIERHPGVREAAVLVREDTPGDKRLVAYVGSAPEATHSSKDLVAWLRESLPEYMVPSAWVKLDAFPLTPNGKIDRRALPEPTDAPRSRSADFIAPRNHHEQQLAEIWERVLGLSPLGVQDDFFDIGGHSLLAVRLVSEIEAKMTTRIPLTTLFQVRTIENLARVVGGHEDATSESAFVAIQATGSRPPLFTGGSHPRYVELSRRLGEQQPFYRLDVYALQNQRLAQGKKPFTQLEDMAYHYVENILRVQPKGPYYLGGGCEGSYAAFEIALQLQKRGHEVACLIMWLAPPLNQNGRSIRRSAPFRLLRQASYLMSGGSVFKMDRRALGVLLKHEYVEYRIFRALDNYRPSGRYKGKITLVRTAESPKSTHDLNKEWQELATEGADVKTVPGNHNNWLEDHLDAFSKLLESRLTAVRGASRIPLPPARTLS